MHKERRAWARLALVALVGGPVAFLGGECLAETPNADDLTGFATQATGVVDNVEVELSADNPAGSEVIEEIASGDPVGEVSAPIEETTDVVKDTTDKAGSAVDDTTDKAGSAVDDTTDKAGNAVDNTSIGTGGDRVSLRVFLARKNSGGSDLASVVKGPATRLDSSETVEEEVGGSSQGSTLELPFGLGKLPLTGASLIVIALMSMGLVALGLMMTRLRGRRRRAAPRELHAGR